MGRSSDDGPLKIREPYDPIGGGGTTALWITYTHKSGEERKLTFLTDQADEADRRIASVRAQ